MTEVQKEQKLLEKRLDDLADKCFRQGIFTFSDFMSMSDISIFHEIKSRFNHVGFELFGEELGCERQLVRFGSEETLGYEEPFPVCLLEIAPLMQKFADKLGHRDFLGAIMNLGIERSTIGDIFIHQNVGYVFCLNTIAEYIIENLVKIKHTNVRIRILEEKDMELFAKPELIPVSITVASERVDGIISKLYNMSRTQSNELFRIGKVFVNGRLCENNSCFLKGNDVVTVRGFGKFVYQGLQRETKKGKQNVGILLYGERK